MGDRAAMSTSRFMLCTMLCIHFAPKSLPCRCHFPFVPTESFQAAEGLFLYPAMNQPVLKISVPLFNTFGLTGEFVLVGNSALV